LVEQTVLSSIMRYLAALKAQGIVLEHAVVFGAQVKGRPHAWSDIDLLVVSPQFDDIEGSDLYPFLWRIAARIDSLIEPIPCGSRQWREDDSSAIIEIARREGEILGAA
jgi:predicted nucleotidyltransferase